MNEEEIWTPIIGFPRYEISNYGRVKSNIGKSKIMKPSKSSRGYYYIDIINDYGSQKLAINRLVYAHFGTYEMTDDLMVDHKDEDKTNNYIGNLQLLTHQENLNKHWSFTKGWDEQQNFKPFVNKKKKLNAKKNFRSMSDLKDNLTIKISKEEYNLIYNICKKENLNVTEFIYNAILFYIDNDNIEDEMKEESFINIIKRGDWLFD